MYSRNEGFGRLPCAIMSFTGFRFVLILVTIDA